MGFLHNTFSDIYARRDNWLTRIDVRIKLCYLVLILAANTWARNIFVPLSFLLASLIFLLSTRIPLRPVIRSMSLPVLFALFILLLKGFHEGEREWISFSVIGYKLVLKKEGILSGLITGSKILGGISVVILFSFTTMISQLCAGLKWFRIPDTIVDILAFMYRYIFLFLDEASVLWNAQRSRLGHTSWMKTIKSLGTMGGLLAIRSIDRSKRTSEAMHARGYKGGGILTVLLPQWTKREYAFLAGIIILFPFLMYMGNLQIW